MKRSIYIIRFACAMALAGCSGSDNVGDVMPTGNNSDEAIVFTTNLDDALWQEPTRATTGAISDLTTVPEGFGVIAYLTDGQTWSEAKSEWVTSGVTNKEYGTESNFPRPDFMYNQPVAWGITKVDDTDPENIVYTHDWVYSPLKYWPNSTNNTTNRYVSFFAYAPFVEGTVLDAASGTGITGMTWADDLRPHVIYTVDENGAPVDLLWAANDSRIDCTRNGNGLIEKTTTGEPGEEVTTLTYQKVPLEFKHALACLDVYVQRVYDEPTFSGKTPDSEANTTKLFMQELKLICTNTASLGLFKKGRLNLEDGTWSSFADANNGGAQAWQAGEASLTFPSTAFVSELAGADADADLEKEEDIAEVRNLELEKWGVPTTGVDQDETLLFKGGSIMLIPQSAELTITPSIKYSMVTRGDPGDLIYSPLVDAAGNHYSRVLNNVTGNTLQLKLEASKRYKLVIRIGVEHVSFVVASVEDWDFPIRLTTSVGSGKDDEISHKLNEE